MHMHFSVISILLATYLLQKILISRNYISHLLPVSKNDKITEKLRLSKMGKNNFVGSVLVS